MGIALCPCRHTGEPALSPPPGLVADVATSPYVRCSHRRRGSVGLVRVLSGGRIEEWRNRGDGESHLIVLAHGKPAVALRTRSVDNTRGRGCGISGSARSSIGIEVMGPTVSMMHQARNGYPAAPPGGHPTMHRPLAADETRPDQSPDLPMPGHRLTPNRIPRPQAGTTAPRRRTAHRRCPGCWSGGRRRWCCRVGTGRESQSRRRSPSLR